MKLYAGNRIKSSFKIRKAKETDFKEFSKIDKEVWHKNYVGILDFYDGTERLPSVSWDKENYAKGKLSILVAETQQKILGYIVTSKKNNTVWIHDILVRKKYQNKGIGSALIKHACKSNKVLLTVNEGNKKAIIFFKKLGFKPLLRDVLMSKN